jgi:hypothetical protein
MKNIKWSLFILLIVAALQLAACAPSSKPGEKVSPFTLEEIEGSELKQVILTEKAAERINVQTAPAQGTVVPYAAVIYDTEGNTWVYTSPAPLTFVRAPIVIDHIEGDQAFLSKGLESDAPIVTVGVAEIYGAETGVSK